MAGLTQVAFGLAFDRWLWGRELSPTHLLGTALVLAPTAWLLWNRALDQSTKPVRGIHGEHADTGSKG